MSAFFAAANPLLQLLYRGIVLLAKLVGPMYAMLIHVAGTSASVAQAEMALRYKVHTHLQGHFYGERGFRIGCSFSFRMCC
jgi:hypothetical protein